MDFNSANLSFDATIKKGLDEITGAVKTFTIDSKQLLIAYIGTKSYWIVNPEIRLASGATPTLTVDSGLCAVKNQTVGFELYSGWPKTCVIHVVAPGNDSFEPLAIDLALTADRRHIVVTAAVAKKTVNGVDQYVVTPNTEGYEVRTAAPSGKCQNVPDSAGKATNSWVLVTGAKECEVLVAAGNIDGSAESGCAKVVIPDGTIRPC